ncbi:MAG: hypothetical protein CMO74_05990 [Verrucomicrobiales bacterium]|nr:hypothetical protein [Verrucomicrobiales bacterium]|tara:strand:+ start:1547 stop:2617 length:1071 start_codon:yes stop_codon:yes gene_type:complete
MRKGERLGLVIGLAVVGLGVGTAMVWQIQNAEPPLPPRATEAALPELGVYEQPGVWTQSGRYVYPESNKTLDFTAEDHSYFTFGGRALMQETRYTVENGEDNELAVRGWNETAKKHSYLLVTDTGRIVTFEGDWSAMDRTMQWEITHPATNSLKMSVDFQEIIPAPNRKRLNWEWRTFATVLKEVQVDCARQGDRAGPSPSEFGKPAREELKLLGEDGTWTERQFYGEEGGGMRMKGRARWAAGGNCLVYEGVVTSGDSEGAPVLWVKTYDSEVKVYRYAYFGANGGVDHYVGRWDPDNNKMVWRCRKLNSAASPDMSSVIEETFTMSGHKAWTFKVREFGKIVIEGRGDSLRVDE